MFNNKSFLAIIPARGGSKRLPGKNIKPLLGKPLIIWTINAALKSEYIDKVVVSSDDELILSVSKEAGAEIIKRPEDLASDISTTFDAIKHTVDNIQKHDFVVLLQPTSPLRNEKHIDEAIKMLCDKKADAIISVAEAEHSPLWCNTLPQNGCMEKFIREEVSNKRSQDLNKFYRLNGAIYVCKTQRLLKEKTFFLSDNIFAYKMNKVSSIDIDEELDFKFVEFLLSSSSS